MAEKMDLSVAYIGMLERGEKLASVPLLLQFAGLCGTSVASLLGEPSIDPWLEEAVTLLRALPAGARDLVLGMLRGAASVVPSAEPATAKRGRATRSRSSRRP